MDLRIKFNLVVVVVAAPLAPGIVVLNAVVSKWIRNGPIVGTSSLPCKESY
jgi:hypothetical protein